MSKQQLVEIEIPSHLEKYFPEYVPILYDENFRKYTLGGGECRCTSGWLAHIFPRTQARIIVARELRVEINKLTDGSTNSVVGYNDSPQTTMAALAKLWNKIMRRVGYVHNFYEEEEESCQKD